MPEQLIHKQQTSFLVAVKTNTIDWVAYTTEFYFSHSWMLEVQDQGTDRFCS